MARGRGFRKRWRAVPTAIAMAMTGAVAGADPAVAAAGAPERSRTGTSAATWKVGDCFADADVDGAEVDLGTKVACTKEHAAQIMGGGALPASLASMSRAELLATTGADRAALDDAATEICAPSETVGNLYPKKTAKRLIALFDQYDVTEWTPPVAGRFTALLPDAASFDAGATDVLCGFLPDESFSGSTAGDIRRVSTTDTLESLRICYVRNPGSGTELSGCDADHDFEALVFLEQDVSALPTDPTRWSGDDWAPFDEMCADAAPILVGATRTDLAYRANTQPDVAPVDGYRFIYCEAGAAADGARLPGGTTVTGIGKKKIRFATN